jgi:hypothetical protein
MNYRKYLQDQFDALELYATYGPPDATPGGPNHDDYFISDQVADIVADVRRTACRFGPDPGACSDDRAMLYLVAASTGLRAGELHTVPLRADLVPVLRSWLRLGQLWPGNWHKKAATMLYRDLAAARAAWIKEADPADQAAREQSCFLREEDEAGRVFDFHSLRRQFVTSLARAGIHPRTAQKLARHKTLALTMENYTHTDLADMATALATLPPLRKIGTKIGTSADDIGGQGMAERQAKRRERTTRSDMLGPLANREPTGRFLLQ